MIVVAAFAVVLNTLIAVWLRGEAKHDLNIRSAYVHMLGDALSSLGVIVAGVVVYSTGSTWADPVVSLLIAGFILWSSWPVLKESVGVLMEASPGGLDVMAVQKAVNDIDAVQDVHDLHVWTLSSGRVACSLHILVNQGMTLPESQRLQATIAKKLEGDFHIAHSTIQVEATGCGVDTLHCTPHQVRSHDEHG